MKLLAKIFINGIIEAKTGLHIGGSSSALDIGGIDNNVVKNAEGVPYIPGSSLRGKMRSLMEMIYSDCTQKTGRVDDGREKDGNPSIQKIFGTVAGKENISAEDRKKPSRTRLVVRDSFLCDETKKLMKPDNNKKDESNPFYDLELDYTEAKWENTIDRLTSSANPRQLERVPAGAKFDFSMVFSFYGQYGENDQENDLELLPKVFEALQLVQDDYLGGSGSRGSGQVAFSNISVSYKNTGHYESLGEGKNLITSGNDLKEIMNNVKSELDSVVK